MWLDGSRRWADPDSYLLGKSSWAGLVGLYALSASYHLLSWAPTARRRMRQLDHEMIFLFIAASAAFSTTRGEPTASLLHHFR